MVRQNQERRETVYNSPMHQAAFNGDLEALRELLCTADNKKNINLKNHLGCTPLRLAATAGSQPCVEFLVANGADINLTDIKGQTPLFVAVKNNHPGCVRALVSYGANPDGSPHCLSSPLFIAAMQGLYECLLVLVQAGADVNCHLISGPYIPMSNTPLHISFTYRHRKCFRALLVAGADPDCGLTPKYLEVRPSLLDAAIQWGDIYFVKLLVEFGGTMTKNNRKFGGDQMTEKELEVQAFLRTCKLKFHRSLDKSCQIFIVSHIHVTSVTV